MDLRNLPVSETLDWAKALVALNVEEIDNEPGEHPQRALKHEQDLQRAPNSSSHPPRRNSPDDFEL
jgi:hypothetical protein